MLFAKIAPCSWRSTNKAMGAPENVRDLCRQYRDLFGSNQAMADALQVEEEIVRAMTEGRIYPALEVMVAIQAGLRKAALLKERDSDDRDTTDMPSAPVLRAERAAS